MPGARCSGASMLAWFVRTGAADSSRGWGDLHSMPAQCHSCHFDDMPGTPSSMHVRLPLSRPGWLKRKTSESSLLLSPHKHEAGARRVRFELVGQVGMR